MSPETLSFRHHTHRHMRGNTGLRARQPCGIPTRVLRCTKRKDIAEQRLRPYQEQPPFVHSPCPTSFPAVPVRSSRALGFTVSHSAHPMIATTANHTHRHSGETRIMATAHHKRPPFQINNAHLGMVLLSIMGIPVRLEKQTSCSAIAYLMPRKILRDSLLRLAADCTPHRQETPQRDIWP